uniref:Uncharacterized protein n=1 Tax=Aegilops tauschii subsp. strangulata TaxID=200361 RepID=A0A453BWK4_AEGTS
GGTARSAVPLLPPTSLLRTNKPPGSTQKKKKKKEQASRAPSSGRSTPTRRISLSIVVAIHITRSTELPRRGDPPGLVDFFSWSSWSSNCSWVSSNFGGSTVQQNPKPYVRSAPLPSSATFMIL